jgi:exopolysaccharide production protein ExoQ
MSLEQPWIGHGIYSFRALIPAIGTFQPWHAHNELLQEFFEYGLLGVAVTIGLYLSLMIGGRRSPDRSFGRLAEVIVVFSLIHGLADTANFGLSLPLCLFAALAVPLMQPDALEAARP